LTPGNKAKEADAANDPHKEALVARATLAATAHRAAILTTVVLAATLATAHRAVTLTTVVLVATLATARRAVTLKRARLVETLRTARRAPSLSPPNQPPKLAKTLRLQKLAMSALTKTR
jgi:hypothetical protein